MKALITAGGKGTRLRPLTHTLNKHLIPIANKPILHYALEYVAEAGVKEAAIIVNAGSTEVQDALGDGAQWGLRLTYIPQEAPLGLAHCVKISRKFIGDEPFIFYLGDNMVVGGISRFCDEFTRNKSNCHLVLAQVPDPERFGVPVIEGDRITAVEEKPAQPKSKYAVAGIYLYDSSIFDAVHAIKPSARGELEISDAHQWLLDHGKKVTFSEITGWWKDTGLPMDLLEANRLVLDHVENLRVDSAIVEGNSRVTGRVILQPGARIIDSHIRGPAIIGQNTVIKNSYIGPYTSIYRECIIENSELEFSIVLERCQVKDIGARIECSLLGCDVRLRCTHEKPLAHRFVVGDQGMIEIA